MCVRNKFRARILLIGQCFRLEILIGVKSLVDICRRPGALPAWARGLGWYDGNRRHTRVSGTWYMPASTDHIRDTSNNTSTGRMRNLDLYVISVGGPLGVYDE